jgi:hypothetical protein
MTFRALPCLAAALAVTFALTGAPAQAASSKADSSTAKKQKSHSVKFHKNPYQETTAERERRLKRECKGLPNAGACLGYAD